ncbi:MAG: hypothetical protein GXO29_03465 [Thermotogae bacterium]|nr:hypothetical protein [Thermotogota bacterium]
MRSRILGAMAYLPFLFILILFLPKDKFVIFHIRQGFVLSTLWLLWLFVWRFVPLVGWALLAPVGLIFLIYLTIFGMVKAASGHVEPLPIVGRWADRLRL